MSREWQRLQAAAHGLGYAVRSERHCQYHLIATGLVFVAAWWFQISPLELAVLSLAIGLVWVAELLNTSIERLVDQRSRKRSVTSKMIKDTAASAVLIAAVTSVVVGAIVFTPYLKHAWRHSAVIQEGQ